MSCPPEPTNTGSPKGSPPTTAILPPSLAAARDKHDRARCISMKLQNDYEAFLCKVEPELEPDEERPEPDHQASLELASLGIELASKEKEVINLERDVVAEEQSAGILPRRAAEKRLQDLGHRYLSAGDDLWRHQKKRARLDDPGTVRLLEPRGNGLSECLLALYKKSDQQDKPKKTPKNFRQDAIAYYKGSSDQHRNPDSAEVWCHVSGIWHPCNHIKAAHIVPFFLDSESIGEMLFGSRAESLQRAGNALLLSDLIKRWFDSYHLVIVPVDATENPIKRWRTDIISPDINKTAFALGRYARELHGKELEFLNDKRPVSRFIYFHFVMALVRIKDLKRRGWQNVWAQYYEQRPFPTPGPYMRQSMLLALATHFEATDMHVVNSWIADNGFDSPLQLNNEEATEAARRVHVALEYTASRAEKLESSDEEDSGDSSNKEE